MKGSLQYRIRGLDILITVVGNEGYPSEGVAVFGLHGVRRLRTAKRRRPTDTV